ncbi:MAG: sensor histidine kinase [Arachnia sp.]
MGSAEPAADASAAAPRFLAASPWIADAAAGAVLLGVGAVSRPTVSFATAQHTGYSLLVFGCCAAVVLRHRAPRGSLIAIGCLLLVHLLAGPEPGIFALAMCVVAVDTAQTETPCPQRWIFTALTVVGAVSGTLAASAFHGGDGRSRAIAVLAVAALLTVVALVGVLRRQARGRYAAAVERAAELEARRETEWQLAAAEERARIARDMHDVLAHSMNVIAVQAEAARYALRIDPAQADTALGHIAHVSREAVDEVRGLIDVLRADQQPPDTRPAPSLADVTELADSHRGAGGRIRLHVTGELADVPAHVGLTGYRIVQEALTNAARHAPDAAVMLTLAVTDHAVELSITNPLTGDPGPAEPGHGLMGIRERAAALGGTATAGPDPGCGRWRVAAQLPRSRP